MNQQKKKQDVIIFYENEIKMDADSDGGNLRIEVPLKVVQQKLGSYGKVRVTAPSPYQSIDELYAVFMPKFSKFGVNADLIKTFLNLNCQQTKSGSRQITVLLGISQQLLSLANIYGPKMNEGLINCNTPQRCNVAYIKKVLKNRTTMAKEKEKENATRYRATIEKAKAEVKASAVKPNDTVQKLEKIKELPENQYHALRKVAKKQVIAENNGQAPMGMGVSMRFKMGEILNHMDMNQILAQAGPIEQNEAPANEDRQVRMFVDTMLDSGHSLEQVAEVLPEAYKNDFKRIYGVA